MASHLGQFLKVIFVLFLFVFLPSELSHTKPCLNWMFSFCTCKLGLLHHNTHKQLSVSNTEFIQWQNKSTLHTRIQSTCNMYLLCHSILYLHQWSFCYILFHDIIKWILWLYDDFSPRRRINAHWLLTPVPGFISFFIFFLIWSLCVETAIVLVVNGVYWQIAFWCCCCLTRCTVSTSSRVICATGALWRHLVITE